MKNIREFVKQISIPRFPGSAGAQKVRSILAHELRDMDVSEQRFVRSIHGVDVTFTNLIATNTAKSPDILLIAHADTLKDYEGAIDAATSMVALCVLAKVVQRLGTVMVAFVDGEEPYPPHSWSHDTAMSGSIYLARQLEVQKRIPKYILVLDLIGGDSTFQLNRLANVRSRRLFDRLIAIDRQLFPHMPPLFRPGRRVKNTQNDSWPFMQRPDVYSNILDIMVHPFPYQWHQRGIDTWHNVDYPTLNRTISILGTFLFDLYRVGDLRAKKPNGKQSQLPY